MEAGGGGGRDLPPNTGGRGRLRPRFRGRRRPRPPVLRVPGWPFELGLRDRREGKGCL